GPCSLPRHRLARSRGVAARAAPDRFSSAHRGATTFAGVGGGIPSRSIRTRRARRVRLSRRVVRCARRDGRLGAPWASAKARVRVRTPRAQEVIPARERRHVLAALAPGPRAASSMEAGAMTRTDRPLCAAGPARSFTCLGFAFTLSADDPDLREVFDHAYSGSSADN